jgi:uncharacterized protein (DUF2147 family)
LTQELDSAGWNPNEANKQQVTEKLYAQCQKTGFDNLNNAILADFGYTAQEAYARLKSYEGKLLRDSLGKYYSIKVNTEIVDSTEEFVPSTASAYTLMANVFNSAFNQLATPNDYAMRYSAEKYQKVVITIKEESTINFKYDMTKTTTTTSDPLYDIICVPYGEITMHLTDTSGTTHDITTSETVSMKLMESLTRQLSSSQVLDLQLVPYCPIPNDITGTKEIKVTDSARIIPCTQNTTYEYGAIVVPSGTFSLAIDETIGINRPTHTENLQGTWLKAGSEYVRGASSASITIPTGDLYDITDATIA